ncbi:GNAT family N-acetyltransferase [Jeotgalibacillus terrae]|uniref:GNAT family N-acetyltransferase n=1 Tax=Jeotgalibacillus terrae TaxID=587735 RepID=A0ABW5ZLX8_9BACL|nr:GNAT family N-acetyltransferase [Jeotgalibacillus terrae]MBM7581154.1 ribosomal protein S18 acetylase RimI-like enzyme [Jeotgalibacillus terrae]
MQIRQIKEGEYDFFLDMLYESIYMTETKPPREALLESEGLKKYHEEWGRPGDEVLVAEKEGELVGAVWYRQFTEEHPGYGFVSPDIPEIGMAVKASERGKGVGRKLLEEVIAFAMSQGYEALSLSVDPFNHHAYKLYKSVGFYKVGTSGTSVTMQASLVEADRKIRGITRTKDLSHSKSKGHRESRISKVAVGAICLLSGVILMAGSWIASAIYATAMTVWDGRYGLFFSAMLETSVAPLILSAGLMLSGLVLILNERELWHSNKGEM